MLLCPKPSGIFSFKILCSSSSLFCVQGSTVSVGHSQVSRLLVCTRFRKGPHELGFRDMKLKRCNVKWLAQGHKTEMWRRQVFCQAQCSLIHCLPAAAPGRIDVSSRWQFCGGDGCPFVAFHCFPSYFDALLLLLASEGCLTNHQR